MERRNSEYALIESQRELEPHSLQLSEANQWADQAQRERIHLCGQLEMKSRLHRECYARSCREIEELKKHCYQEENAARRRKLGELPTQHDQESRTVSLLQDQVRRLQERLEFIEDSKIFQDPDSPSSFDSAHVPYQVLITSSSIKPSRESRMQRNTREDVQQQLLLLPQPQPNKKKHNPTKPQPQQKPQPQPQPQPPTTTTPPPHQPPPTTTNQRQPTTTNDNQRQPTTTNDNQRRPTNTQQPTTNNNNQQQPTTNNNNINNKNNNQQ